MALCVSAIGYLNRVNMSVSGSAIIKEFHLSAIQLGWVFSAFTLGYALFQAPTGRLADRLGRGGFSRWQPSGGPCPGPDGHWRHRAFLSRWSFCWRCASLWNGRSAIYPAANRVVAGWIPSPERGLANGWIFAGVGVGAGIAPPLITYLLLHGAGAGPSGSARPSAGGGPGLYLVARDHPSNTHG